MAGQIKIWPNLVTFPKFNAPKTVYFNTYFLFTELLKVGDSLEVSLENW